MLYPLSYGGAGRRRIPEQRLAGLSGILRVQVPFPAAGRRQASSSGYDGCECSG